MYFFHSVVVFLFSLICFADHCLTLEFMHLLGEKIHREF